MKRYDAAHYPIAAIQHTLAVVALSVIQANTDFFRPVNPGFVHKYLEKIEEWSRLCARQTRNKKLSQGARRDMDRCFNVLGAYMDMDSLPMDYRYAALVWTALTFVEDVKNTCPLYWDEEKAWRYLLLNLANYAAKLAEIYEGMDLSGTRLYEHAAWALETINWRSQFEKMGIAEMI